MTEIDKIVKEQNGLKTSIEGLKSANETVNQRLESAEGRLNTIDELIKSLAKSSDVTDSIDQLREEIEAKIGKLNEEGKDDTVASLIAGINTNITTINGNIERIDGALCIMGNGTRFSIKVREKSIIEKRVRDHMFKKLRENQRI